MDVSKVNKKETFPELLEAVVSTNRAEKAFESLDKEDKQILVKTLFSHLKDGENIMYPVSICNIMENETDPKLQKVFEDTLKTQFESNTGDVKRKLGLIANCYLQSRPASFNTAWFQDNNITEKYPLFDAQKIANDDLFDEQGRHHQLVFFYGDKDGKSSFNTWIADYKNENWNIKDKGEFIVITPKTSKEGKEFFMVANKPQYEKSESMWNYLEKESVNKVSLIHRGHSFHVAETLKQMEEYDIKSHFVYLGSCRSYHMVSDFPATYFYSTSGSGTRHVNNPLTKLITQSIIDGEDLVWSDVHKMAGEIIKDSRFNLYVPPSENKAAIFKESYKKGYST